MSHPIAGQIISALPTQGGTFKSTGDPGALKGAALKADVAKIAAALAQWRIGPAGGGSLVPVPTFVENNPTGHFSLLDTKVNRYFRWQTQTFGINLGWTGDAQPTTEKTVRRWFVDRAGDGSQPIRYGERVALGYGLNPSFIRYHDRTIGVNLDWSDSAVYEWEIHGGPAGQPVSRQNPVAIYNSAAGTTASPGNYLVYFDREVGGDIGWPDSRTLLDQGLDLLGKWVWSEAKKAATEALLSAL